MEDISKELVGSKPATILRQTCVFRGISEKGFGKKKQFTAKFRYVMTVARTLLKAPFAHVEMSTPYFNEKVEALCQKIRSLNYSNYWKYFWSESTRRSG